MEDLVCRIAEKGMTDPSWHRLLVAIKTGELTLPDLLKAKNERRLDQLRHMVQDPTLATTIEEYKAISPGYDTENGLRILQEMAKREFGSNPRFGILRTGKNITLLCARAKREGGRPSKKHPQGRPMAHNSARRTVLLSASKLVRFHLGNAERDRIFADVDFPRENDTRDVWLSAEEITQLLDACERWFRPFVLTALATGADRSPLLRMLVRDVKIVFNKKADTFSGAIYLRDSKTDGRPRSVAIIDPVCRVLLPLCSSKEPDDKVFDGSCDPGQERPKPMTTFQVRYWFEKAREKADLEHVRFKDLRRTWAVNADEAGLNLGQIKSGLGHGLDETTVRYTNRQVTLELDAAERVARKMGLVREPPIASHL